MPSVEVNLPNVPQDADVSVPYLGKFKNGTTTEVDEAQWNRYLKHQPGAQDPEGGVLRLGKFEEEEEEGRSTETDTTGSPLERVAQGLGLDTDQYSSEAELSRAIESEATDPSKEV